ncbi:hypothetical protein A3711_06580 [Erythrobacter sp. HI00D59]|nr:hypothetical protein A3711_06580 [Erythrobacter sp. HI00D59]
MPLADKKQIRDWLVEDKLVQALRQLHLWTNLHDQAALATPYLRAEEHSAQQPPHRLREFEEQFKEGDINLLACSTTMEIRPASGRTNSSLQPTPLPVWTSGVLAQSGGYITPQKRPPSTNMAA